MEYHYIEIGTSCFKTLAEVFRSDDEITGLSIEPVPQYLDIIEEHCAGSKNKYFHNCAVTKYSKEAIPFYFIDPLKVRNWPAVGIAGIGCVSEELLKNTIAKATPEFKLTSSQIKKILVPSMKFTEVVERFNIEKVEILKIDAEGCDFDILEAMLETEIRPGVVFFEAEPFMNNEQLQKICSDLRKEGYEIADHSSRNIFCWHQNATELFFCDASQTHEVESVQRAFNKRVVYKNKNDWIKEIQKTSRAPRPAVINKTTSR